MQKMKQFLGWGVLGLTVIAYKGRHGLVMVQSREKLYILSDEPEGLERSNPL